MQRSDKQLKVDMEPTFQVLELSQAILDDAELACDLQQVWNSVL